MRCGVKDTFLQVNSGRLLVGDLCNNERGFDGDLSGDGRCLIDDDLRAGVRCFSGELRLPFEGERTGKFE